MYKIRSLAFVVMMSSLVSACSWFKEKGVGVDHSQDYRQVSQETSLQLPPENNEAAVATDPLFVIPETGAASGNHTAVNHLLLPPESNLARHAENKARPSARAAQEGATQAAKAQAQNKKGYRAKVDINRIGTNSGSVANRLHPESTPKGGIFSLMNSVEEVFRG